MLDLDKIARIAFGSTTSVDVPCAQGIMHIRFKSEVPFSLLVDLDFTQPKNMILALERIRRWGNSKVECVLEHNQDVLNEDPVLREAVERGGFTTTRDIDEYINSIKKEMKIH